MDTTLPTITDAAGSKTPAATLFLVATELAALAQSDPDALDRVSLTLYIQPRENRRDQVDTIALKVLGEPGTTREVGTSRSAWHHTVSGLRDGKVQISVFSGITEPAEVRRARLRAELAALDGAQ